MIRTQIGSPTETPNDENCRASYSPDLSEWGKETCRLEEECSPLTSSADESLKDERFYESIKRSDRTPKNAIAIQRPIQPSWIDGLSPVSTENCEPHTCMHWSDGKTNQNSGPSSPGECITPNEKFASLTMISNRPVPAKLLVKESSEQLLQIQVCWSCRLNLCESKADSADTRTRDMSALATPQLKFPHVAINSWRDVAQAIKREEGLEMSQMIFWLRQSLFAEAEAFTSAFDALCTSTADEYAAAFSAQQQAVAFEEEVCLICRKPAILPVVVNRDAYARRLVADALTHRQTVCRRAKTGHFNTAAWTPELARPSSHTWVNPHHRKGARWTNTFSSPRLRQSTRRKQGTGNRHRFEELIASEAELRERL